MNEQNISTKYKILIVDDTPEILKVLSQILIPHYKVSLATKGSKALEIAKSKTPPALILLDIEMPEMDGYEVCRRLKEDPSTKDIPIIFITARTEISDETKGFKLGAVDYITKPVSHQIVIARVRTQLELKAQRDQLEKANKELRKAAELRTDVEQITRHDLKSPLNAVIGLPDAIKMDGSLNPEQTESLQLIKEAGYTMLEMINNSLNLYKMEQGTYAFSPEKVDILPVIKKVFKELDSLAKIKNLELKLRNDRNSKKEESFGVLAEKLLSYSMFANLIKNAIEASPANEQVIITLNHDSNYAVIAIQNNGVVPLEIRNTFFDKYSSIGKMTGTGLGTYSARLIATTQNGDISMTTSEAKGTIILVNLPKAILH
jgi:two-component system, sensor histidine kinase and response regulator